MPAHNKPAKKLKTPALNRGGMVVGPFHHEEGGGPKFPLSDTGQIIEEEGFEFNIPEEITKSDRIYTFKGKNVEIIHEILKIGGLSAFDKVTHVKSGDLVICIKSAWDDEVRTYTGTIAQILSAINTSCGCKHIEDGAIVQEEGNGNMENGGIAPNSELITPNSSGGYDYSGVANKTAKLCGLITLPKSIEGTNCGNCIFFKDNFCDHYKILLPVTSRQCCALWDDKSLRSHITNISEAYLFPDKSGKDFPLNDNGGYDYTGKALETARGVDLITLPKDIEGTNCASGNCMYAKNNVCIHPKIMLPVTDRMSCGWWNNEQVQRTWGQPVEISFAKQGGKAGIKERIKDWQTENPNSPRWQKKKERITQLSNNIQKLRNKVSRDLNSDDEKEFLTALVIAIMDKTGERVGNDASAGNGHFGVSGFSKRHVNVIGNKVILDYKGKAGVDHEKDFSDEKIANALKKAIKNSPSKLIFTTSDNFHIKADRVNRFLESFGISSKNLRGYFANQNVLKLLKREDKKEQPENEKQRKKIFNRILKQTAKLVGHGAPTLRKHYLIPEIPIEYIEKGNIIDLKTYGYHKDGGEVKLFGGEMGMKKYEGDVIFTDTMKRKVFEIVDKDMTVNYEMLFSDKSSHYLYQVVRHPELYKIYPFSRAIIISLFDISNYPFAIEDEVAGIFDYKKFETKTILTINLYVTQTIREQGRTPEGLSRHDFLPMLQEIKETIIHELQHAIQYHEYGKPGRGYEEILQAVQREAIENISLIKDKSPEEIAQERYEGGFYEKQSAESSKRMNMNADERKNNPPTEIMEQGGVAEESKQVYWTLPKTTPAHNVKDTKIIIEKYDSPVKHPHGEYQLWKVYMEQPNGLQYWDKIGFSYEEAKKYAKDLKETIEAGYEILELTKK